MSGKLVTIVGVMGSGKTEKLIELYKYLFNSGKAVKVFKPMKDTRSKEYVVRARSGATAPATTVQNIDDIYDHEGDLQQVILIDEVQFFDQPDLIDAITSFLALGIDVYCFGLDLTSNGTTFGRVGDLLAQSHEVIKLQSKCVRCGGDARISSYTGNDKFGDVKVGDLDVYEPVCRDCYLDSELGVEDDVTDTDPLHFIGLGGKEYGFTAEMVLKQRTLDQAGYTVEDIKDICTIEGVNNLLEDLGLLDELGGGLE